MPDEIKVKCRNCGRTAKTNEFVLDPDFKMMVCRQCVKEKKMKKEVYDALEKEKKAKNLEKNKPKDWNLDKKYLEKKRRR